MSGISVGIDLGTTNSCIAIYRNEKVEIIRDENDSYIIPSIVTFTETGKLFGNEAKDKSHLYIKNTIYEVKRLIGQNFSNPNVENDISNFPFKVINDSGIPKIEIQTGNELKSYLPEEISAFLLEKLKSSVEEYIADTVKEVVVTIPAYFNEFQRDATKKAAWLAGFKTVHIINEPTAAAIAYNHQHPKTDTKRNVLIYDFGGGTFDVAIATVHRNSCEIKATLGDLHLGGSDVDQNLVNYIANDFKAKFGVNLDIDAQKQRRMKNACEKAKKALSRNDQATISLSQLEKGRDYEISINRLNFEQINKDLFQKTINIVKKCLEKAHLKESDIDEILLVGGSTRIPKMQEMLGELFGKEKLNKTLNPDECVAYGAVIHCIGNKVEVQDVTPLSLGVAVMGKNRGYELELSIIIPCNTPIPVTKSSVYETTYDNQTGASIRVLQGEAELAKDNFELGKFSIKGLTEAPAGITKTNVVFSLDEEGILNVTASEIGKKNSESTKIDVERRGLHGAEFSKRLQEMQQESRSRKVREELLLYQHELEKIALNMRLDENKDD